MSTADDQTPTDQTPTEPDLRDDVEVDALTDAGADEVGEDDDGAPLVEGPNSA